MSFVKVFISYCKEDNTKMEFVKNLINNHPPLKALVVLNENSNLAYSPDKIKNTFSKSTIFLPILTTNSINNQWVNQEIGYAFALTSIKIENIKPIVEKTISNSLKGFISKSNDLNYRFDDDSDFESVATKLVSELFEKYKNQGTYHIN